MTWRHAAFVIAVVVGAGCAQATTSRSDDIATNPNVITAEQLGSSLGLNAFDAIQKLRPQFLVDARAGVSVSSQPTMVSVNGGQLNSLGYLRSIPTATISEIRYLRPGEADQRFGSRSGGSAVILLTLRAK